jgi:hypothetical protein
MVYFLRKLFTFSNPKRYFLVAIIAFNRSSNYIYVKSKQRWCIEFATYRFH